MADLVAEGAQAEGADARTMSIDDVDWAFVRDSQAVIFGSPTYEGTCSWQMKRFLDDESGDLERHPFAGKLGAVFCSQNWPGGGGASFAEMTLIAAMLVRGMLVYAGGITTGMPFLHFGAVSNREPEEPLYRERCLQLGRIVTGKAGELFGH
jgi:NAD(P)H dehydrogenase (quinone)